MSGFIVVCLTPAKYEANIYAMMAELSRDDISDICFTRTCFAIRDVESTRCENRRCMGLSHGTHF